MASTSGVVEAATRSLPTSIRRCLIHCRSMHVNDGEHCTDRRSELSLDFRDLCSESDQPADQLAVAAFDGLERRHARLTIGGETCGNQRHPRSEIATVEDAAAAQSRGAVDDD